MATEGGDTEFERSRPPRQFGQLPDLVVPNDFDEPLPPPKLRCGKRRTPPPRTPTQSLDDAWLAWPSDEADLLDDALGKETGQPRSDTGGHSSP